MINPEQVPHKALQSQLSSAATDASTSSVAEDTAPKRGPRKKKKRGQNRTMYLVHLLLLKTLSLGLAEIQGQTRRERLPGRAKKGEDVLGGEAMPLKNRRIVYIHAVDCPIERR